MIEEMTITQMINEEKLLQTRILNLVNNSDFCFISYCQSNRPYVGARTKDEQEAYQKEKMQELVDLMRRYKAIRKAHTKANHDTMIIVDEQPDLMTFLSGKELAKEEISIAEAINRKNLYKTGKNSRGEAKFSFEAFASILLRKYNHDFSERESFERDAMREVENNLSKKFPEANKASWSQDRYNEEKKKEEEACKILRIDPCNTINTDAVQKYYNAINEYIMKIDSILSEANASTKVIIEY